MADAIAFGDELAIFNAEQMARAWGATPDQIRACAPRCYRFSDRRIDPVQRLGMFKTARDMKMKVDPEQIADECQFVLLAEDEGEQEPGPDPEPDPAPGPAPDQGETPTGTYSAAQ